MNFLLDTNIFSELWKPAPEERILRFVDENNWFIPAPVIAELQSGASSAPTEARKFFLNEKIDRMILEFREALIDFDAETARTWGRLKFSSEVKRRPQALWDSLIDAMAVRYGLKVATRNTADFRHAETFNPWTDSK